MAEADGSVVSNVDKRNVRRRGMEEVEEEEEEEEEKKVFLFGDDAIFLEIDGVWNKREYIFLILLL